MDSFVLLDTGFLDDVVFSSKWAARTWDARCFFAGGSASRCDRNGNRRMTCNPESVSTTPLNSPIFSANVASSKGRCIWPRPKSPKSPASLYDPQSLLEEHSSRKAVSLSGAALMPSNRPSKYLRAWSLDIVICSPVLRLTGFLLSVCLTRRWAQRAVFSRPVTWEDIFVKVQ